MGDSVAHGSCAEYSDTVNSQCQLPGSTSAESTNVSSRQFRLIAMLAVANSRRPVQQVHPVFVGFFDRSCLRPLEGSRKSWARRRENPGIARVGGCKSTTFQIAVDTISVKAAIAWSISSSVL
jgi:hypothetical protein